MASRPMTRMSRCARSRLTTSPCLGQPDYHPPAAVERTFCVLLIDPSHQPQVFGYHTGRLVVKTRPVQLEQFALTADTQLEMADLDQWPLPFSRRRQLFFIRSSSILSRPICSYNSASR